MAEKVPGIKLEVEADNTKLKKGLKQSETMLKGLGKSADAQKIKIGGIAGSFAAVTGAMSTVEGASKTLTGIFKGMRGDTEGMWTAFSTLPAGIGPAISNARALWMEIAGAAAAAEKLAEEQERAAKAAKVADKTNKEGLSAEREILSFFSTPSEKQKKSFAEDLEDRIKKHEAKRDNDIKKMNDAYSKFAVLLNLDDVKDTALTKLFGIEDTVLSFTSKEAEDKIAELERANKELAPKISHFNDNNIRIKENKQLIKQLKEIKVQTDLVNEVRLTKNQALITVTKHHIDALLDLEKLKKTSRLEDLRHSERLKEIDHMRISDIEKKALKAISAEKVENFIEESRAINDLEKKKLKALDKIAAETKKFKSWALHEDQREIRALEEKARTSTSLVIENFKTQKKLLQEQFADQKHQQEAFNRTAIKQAKTQAKAIKANSEARATSEIASNLEKKTRAEAQYQINRLKIAGETDKAILAQEAETRRQKQLPVAAAKEEVKKLQKIYDELGLSQVMGLPADQASDKEVMAAFKALHEAKANVRHEEAKAIVDEEVALQKKLLSVKKAAQDKALKEEKQLAEAKEKKTELELWFKRNTGFQSVGQIDYLSALDRGKPSDETLDELQKQTKALDTISTNIRNMNNGRFQ